MPLTLLLDLGNTLLQTNMDVFSPVYFEKLTGFLAGQAGAQKLVQEMLTGLDLIGANERPDVTLGGLFYQHLRDAFHGTGFERELEHFHRDVFPSMAETSTARPGAVEIVEYAFEKGWRVVIAADPLQPRKLVEQQLRWAGLPAEKYPFAWVASMETSHFAKAHPSYYAEILGNLGWPGGPALAVGDDPRLDVDSASRAGLPVFWVHPADFSVLREDGLTPGLARAPQGSLRDLLGWFKAVELDRLRPDFASPQALTASLQSTPAVLDGLLRGLQPAGWTTRSDRHEWALVEIICHLRDMDVEVNLTRLETLMAADNPFIVGQDTDPWAAERRYIEQDGPAAFRDFVAARMRLLEILKSLPAESWQRRARHTIFGPTDVHELVGFMAEHDRTHIRQARALLLGDRALSSHKP